MKHEWQRTHTMNPILFNVLFFGVTVVNAVGSLFFFSSWYLMSVFDDEVLNKASEEYARKAFNYFFTYWTFGWALLPMCFGVCVCLLSLSRIRNVSARVSSTGFKALSGTSFAVSYIAGGCFTPLLVRKTVCEFIANELEEFILRLIGTCEVGYTAIVFGTLSAACCWHLCSDKLRCLLLRVIARELSTGKRRA
jgi:hypothetical protein